MEEDEEEPTPFEYQEKLKRLEKFYTNIGFINVNHSIGQYEHKISFIYNEGIGRSIIPFL